MIDMFECMVRNLKKKKLQKQVDKLIRTYPSNKIIKFDIVDDMVLANLHKTTINGYVFKNCIFRGNISILAFTNCVFDRCDFKHANFADVSPLNCKFYNCTPCIFSDSSVYDN